MKNLFDYMRFSPATRKQDPLTSFVAEEKITKSGTRLSHCQQILYALEVWNGSTSVELAKYTGLRHDQIWRRRKDLENNNVIFVEGERNGFGIWWLIK